jgi:hypothetical protein
MDLPEDLIKYLIQFVQKASEPYAVNMQRTINMISRRNLVRVGYMNPAPYPNQYFKNWEDQDYRDRYGLLLWHNRRYGPGF